MQRVVDSELEQPLLTATGSGIPGPRILDRDGDFSQSRGRWRVSNMNSRSRASSGHVRQRHSVSDTISTSSAGQGGTALSTNRATPTLPRRRQSPPVTFCDRLCCRSNGCCCREVDNQPRLTPRRCWDDWFRELFRNIYVTQLVRN